LAERLFNIHFGPLPTYKGPVPVFLKLKHGVEKIGLSIHRLTEKFDEGPAVWHKEFLNQDFFNDEAINKNLSNMSLEGVLSILNLLAYNIPILPVNVSGKEKGTYYKRPNAAEVTISWNKMSAAEICSLIKVCNPWDKEAVTFIQVKEVRILNAQIICNTTKITLHPKKRP
jgi:methionyl-tRNA formyltransferase